MKKRVTPQKIGFLYGLGALFGVVFLGGIVGAFLSLYDMRLSVITIAISIIWGISACFNSRRNQKISNYINSISSAYRWSIREALKTEYPQGIIYIVGNTLKELEKFGIKDQPYKESYSNSESWSNQNGYSYSKSISDVRGFPNQTNLKAVIYQAEHLSQEWGQLNNVERINAMKEIWAMIEKEDMWLDWKVMRVNLGKEIYWYSYDESDHRAFFQHNYNPITSSSAQHHLPQSTQPVFNPPYHPQPTLIPEPKPPVNNPPSPPSQRVLTFEEFLQQHPGVKYLEKPEDQREEYHKYLASMGVQPPSSTSRPYSPDNSNYGTGNKGDDSVW
jgi:hypothetical protein